MDKENINKLFELFSQEPADCYQTFIVDAIRNVSGMKKQEKEWDIRLDYLTAAMASYDLAKVQSLNRYAYLPNKKIVFAEQLVLSYKELCKDLIKNGDRIMSREIFFRGKDDAGWVYGDLIHHDGNVYIKPYLEGIEYIIQP